jgi:hypothetical protein
LVEAVFFRTRGAFRSTRGTVPFNLKQRGLCRIREPTFNLGLLTFAHEPFTINSDFADEVESVAREAEFPLWNQQPSSGSFHTLSRIEVTKFS